MKNILSYLILILYVLSTFIYWADVWGGIGFFGAILTFPFSVLFAWIFSFFEGWWLWNLIAAAAMISLFYQDS